MSTSTPTRVAQCHVGDPPLWWGPWDTAPWGPCPPSPPWAPSPIPPSPPIFRPSWADYCRGYQIGKAEGFAAGEASGKSLGALTENRRLRHRLLQAGLPPDLIEQILAPSGCPIPALPGALDAIIQQARQAKDLR